MKFLVISAVAFSIAVSAFAKVEKKKLDLTTITKPLPKAEPEPTLTEPLVASEAVTETTPVSPGNVRDGYTPIDLRQLKDVNKPIKMNSTATVKCRASTGVQYLPTDSGFEGCLKQNEIENSRAANRDGDQDRNFEQTPGQSVEFSFGESN